MFNNVKSNDLIKKNKTCSEFSSFNSFISNNTNKTVQLSVADIKNFKNLLKREHLKKLNKYRENLDKKIELLKGKLYNSQNKTIKEETSEKENEKEENKVILINYKKFAEIYIGNNNTFLKITNFLDTNDLYRLFTLNNEIHQGIISNLIDITKEKIIPNYILKYNNDIIFSESKFFLIFKKYKKNKKMNLRIILNIKSKITEKNSDIINNSYQISFKNKTKQTSGEIIKTISSYTFDIINKKQKKNFWLFKEYTSFHFDELDRAYYGNILQFYPNDIINISLTIFSEIGLINFESFNWIKLKEYYDKKRECEVEHLKNSWCGINQIENSDIVIQNIKNIFIDNFQVENIFFDDVGYYIFKIVLKAIKEGLTYGKDNNIGILIKIFKEGEAIENEVKKNGLIFDEKNELSVNIGDYITFYISQNK